MGLKYEETHHQYWKGVIDTYEKTLEEYKDKNIELEKKIFIKDLDIMEKNDEIFRLKKEITELKKKIDNLTPTKKRTLISDADFPNSESITIPFDPNRVRITKNIL